jgi:hypothetical protein
MASGVHSSQSLFTGGRFPMFAAPRLFPRPETSYRLL